MSFFNKIKNIFSSKSDNKKSSIKVSLEDYLKFDPIAKTIHLLNLWKNKYSKELNIINPEILKLCSDQESIELLLSYAGDIIPSEMVKSPQKIIYKQTLSYFYGLYLYKELTGEIYNQELNHKNILKPGIYQFFRKALEDDYKKRTQYPEDLLFFLDLQVKEDVEELNNFENIKMELFTTIGLFRKENQDNCGYLVEDKNNSIFIVADGMGGGAEGKKASAMAVNLIKTNYKSFEIDKLLDSEIEEKINEFIKSTILQVNKAILNFSKINKLKDMGTTISLVMIHNEKLYIGHVGDSRIYLVRDKKVQQLSLDQSNVEVLLREGKITKDQTDNYEKNVLAYYLGYENLTENDICTINKNDSLSNLAGQKDNSLHIQDNDIFFICSDGVWDVFEEKNILQELTMGYEELKDMIYSRIPTDNFTFIRGVVRD